VKRAARIHGDVSSTWARAALSHCAFHGLPPTILSALIIELAPRYDAVRESRLRQARGRDRLRAAGAGRPATLVFTDAVLVTLAYLRLGLSQRALGVLVDVDQSTVSRAICILRPLLATRGFAPPTGPRLRTLADVLAYANTTGFDLCLDGTDITVRRPTATRGGRRAFINGKKRRHTIKTTIICDQAGRLLWAGATRPGRMHDQTAIKTEGLDNLLHHYPRVRIRADQAYRGLSKHHPGQIITKQPAPVDTCPPELAQHLIAIRKLHSQQRIPVEHVIGRLKTWKQLAHWNGPRTNLPETITAIAGLAADITTHQ
jgi:DDE superfamily endonuclease/Helix-turn-helix of DDE superfamily endonuclease